MKKIIRGYLYYMFPVETEEDSDEFAVVENSFMWKYCSWLFYIIRMLMEVACFMADVEPQFVIYVPRYKK